MEKLLLSGHAVESLRSLRQHGLHHGVLPLLDVILEQPLGSRFIELAFANTDERVRTGKSVTPAFLFATLLWHEVLVSWNAAKAKGERPIPALFAAMDRVLEQQAERLAIPRRFEATIKEIWALQPRFEQRAGQRPFRLLEHPRFRAAYDFLWLRGAQRRNPASNSPIGGSASSLLTAPSASACCDRTKRRASGAARPRAQAQRGHTRRSGPADAFGAMRPATGR